MDTVEGIPLSRSRAAAPPRRRRAGRAANAPSGPMALWAVIAVAASVVGLSLQPSSATSTPCAFDDAPHDATVGRQPAAPSPTPPADTVYAVYDPRAGVDNDPALDIRRVTVGSDANMIVVRAEFAELGRAKHLSTRRLRATLVGFLGNNGIGASITATATFWGENSVPAMTENAVVDYEVKVGTSNTINSADAKVTTDLATASVTFFIPRADVAAVNAAWGLNDTRLGIGSTLTARGHHPVRQLANDVSLWTDESSLSGYRLGDTSCLDPAKVGSEVVVPDLIDPAVVDGIDARPRGTCTYAVDPPNDNAARALAASDGDVDLTGLTVKTMPRNLEFFVKVRDLGPPGSGVATASDPAATPSPYTRSGFGRRADITFRVPSATDAAALRTVTVGATQVQSVSDPVSHLMVDGQARKISSADVSANFDRDSNTVVISLRPGRLIRDVVINSSTALRQLSVTTYWVASPARAATAGTETQADVLTVAEPYEVGDNACFAPAMFSGTAPRTQYGDVATFRVKVTDGGGRPARGVTVRASLGLEQTTAETGGNGFATVTLPVDVRAGQREITLSTGDSGRVGAAEAEVPITVLVEPTRLRLTVRTVRGVRYVDAQLVDDDGSPVPYEPLTYRVDGRRLTEVETNGAGRATVKVPSRKTITVRYDGWAGRYGSATATKRS